MVRILGFFLLGVFLFDQFENHTTIKVIWMITGILVGLFGLFQIKRLRKWSGIPGLIFITFSGWLITAQFDESTDKNHLLRNNQTIDAYTALLLDQPEKTRNGYRLAIWVIKVRINNSWRSFHTKAYCYLKESPDINAGNTIVIRGNPKIISKKNSANSFDIALYLKRKNIFFQDFIGKNEYCIVKSSTASFHSQAIQIREWCLRQIKAYVPGNNEQAIASALLIGQSGELDPELNQHYAVTGTLHVLSVSGMHTGLLYWIILLLCKPLKLLKNGEWITTGIVIFILWIYAVVTGLSPSVLRAVVMLSFVTLSRPFGLRSNIWNTLAASAFLLLLIDPWLITRISFQLSYLAVIGIVWIHPQLVRQWEPESWLLSGAWNLTSVSISAQLTTLPVSILNFHQFPIWFIPANLIIIPLSSIALFSGLAFLPLSVFTPIAPLAGWILSKEIQLMNKITVFLGQWPLGPFTGIHIKPVQALCMMTMLIGLERYQKLRNGWWLTILLVSAAVFSLIDLIY